jgi:hypothetical protein
MGLDAYQTHAFHALGLCMKTKNKLLIVFASIAGLLLLFIILAPPITSMLISSTLHDAGADEVTIGDIDFNPLVGTARIHQLVVRKDGKRVISLGHGFINLRITSLFKKQIEIDQIVLKNGYAAILESEEGKFGLRGIEFSSETTAETEQTPSTPSEWTFGLHEIDIESVAVRLDAIKTSTIIQADKLVLNKVYTWDKDGISELQAQGRFNEGRFTLNTRLSPLAALPRVTGDLKLDAINLADIHPWIQEYLEGLGGLVSLDSKINIERQSETKWLINLDPDLQLNKLYVSTQGFNLDSEAINFSGRVNIAIDIAETSPDISATGNIRASSLHLTSPEAITLAQLGSASIQDINFTLPIDISASQISLNDARLLKAESDNTPVVTWGAIEINNARTTPELTHLESVAVNSLGVTLQRRKDGSLYLPLPKSKSQSNEAEVASRPDEASAENSKTMGIRIDQLNISRDSQIDFADSSVKPAYSAKVKLKNFSVKNINTSNINQATAIDISAVINRYAEVSTNGYIKPFMEIPDASLKTKISGVNLTRISAYAVDRSGYLINNGSMNLESDLKIENNIIDETIRLKLHNLELEVGDQEKASATDAKLAIGLPAALSLLKDSKDDIKLNLPITGDLTDPNFDFSHAITVVLSKALTKGTTAYAAYALQPWGAALIVKDVAGKLVTQVNLDPIFYEPGAIELKSDMALYLEKISGLMKERPGVELNICARATEADRKAMARRILDEKRYLKKDEPTLEQAREVVADDILLTLAEDRMFSIKDILIEQHEIPQHRLQTCLPKLDANIDAAPMVDLQI